MKEWPKDGPPLAWRATGLGGGDSAPAVAQGRIFGMSNRGEDEVVWGLSERDGRELWTARLGPAYSQRGFPRSKEGPGGTPTVDGDRLLWRSLDRVCFEVGQDERCAGLGKRSRRCQSHAGSRPGDECHFAAEVQWNILPTLLHSGLMSRPIFAQI